MKRSLWPDGGMTQRDATAVADGDGSDPDEDLPNVAIIAVHGVADQEPLRSARQIADLLLRRRYAKEAPVYTSFREYPIRIPIDAATPSKEPAPDEAADIAFTRAVLRCYQTEHSAYETIRLEGHRLLPPESSGGASGKPRDQGNVHVYEMYWADLSRLGTGIIGVAGAAFQLISSLAALGLRTMRLSGFPEGSAFTRRLALRSHTVAVWALTVAVLFFNLGLLAVALSVPIAAAPSQFQRSFVGTLVAVVLMWAVGSGWLQWGHKTKFGVRSLMLALFICGVLGVLLVVALSWAGEVAALRSAIFFWGVAAGVCVIALGKQYARRHDGVKPVTFLVAGVVVAGLAIVASRSGDRVDIADGTIRVFEVIFWLMSASWLLTILAAAVSGVTAFRLSRGHAEFRRSAWTAATTLALSMATVGVLAIVLWSVLHIMIGRTLPSWNEASARTDSVHVSPSNRAYAMTADSSFGYTSVLGQHITFARDDSVRAVRGVSRQICFDRVPVSGSITSYGWCQLFSQKSMPRYLISLSAASGLLVTLACLLIIVLCGIFLVAPSVLQEIHPTKNKDVTSGLSQQLGRWLSFGFTLFRWSSIGVYALLEAGTITIVALGLWLRFLPENAVAPAKVYDLVRSLADTAALAIGSAIAASMVGVLVVLSRFENIARVVRPVLDVLLDVDNYLRDRPDTNLPKARMLERMVSLMRYISHWQRSGRGYDAVVVIAHSQGTVLAVEALRFHRNVGFNGLKPLPGSDGEEPSGSAFDRFPEVHLITMGSPLRQLYERSFPRHFAWAGTTECPPEGPRCDHLGVQQWVNVYRSGDYVGRTLWQSPDDPRTYEVRDDWFGEHPCRERCLGEGAHTHYWDAMATDVSRDFDEVVDEAIKGAERGLSSGEGRPTRSRQKA